MTQQYGRCSVCGAFGPVRQVDTKCKAMVCAGGCKPKLLPKDAAKLRRNR